jgi:hypothetical protein
MAEPISTSTTSVGLLGVFVFLFGPLAGEWALIIFAALAGSMWSVGRVATQTKSESAWLLVKLVLAAVIFTGGAATLLEAKLGWPARQALAPAAYLIGFVGDRWASILRSTIDIFIGRSTK